MRNNRRTQRNRQCQTMSFQELEPRQLMAADLTGAAPTIQTDASPQITMVDTQESGNALESRRLDDHVNQAGSHATKIAIGENGKGTGFGTMEVSNDADVFQFDVSESSKATIKVDAVYSGFDPILQIMNSKGEVIATNDDGGEGYNSLATLDLEAGTYFAKVTSYGQAEGRQYFVGVSLEANGAQDDHANDIGEKATKIAIGEDGKGTGFGTMEVSNDADVFQFDVSESSKATIKVDAVYSGFDPVLQIMNSKGEVIATNDDGGEGFNSLATLDLEAGTYFAKVTSYGQAEGRQYFVGVSLEANGSQDDHADSPSMGATNIEIGTNGVGYATGQMNSATDADVFHFRVTESGRATIAVNAVFSSFDPMLQILNADGEVIAQDNNSGERLNSLAQLDLEAGDYFIRVTSVGDATGRQYGVTVNIDSTMTSPFASLDRVFESMSGAM